MTKLLQTLEISLKMAPKWGSWGVKNIFFQKRVKMESRRAKIEKKSAWGQGLAPTFGEIGAPKGAQRAPQIDPKPVKVVPQEDFFLDGVLDHFFHGIWMKNGSKNL